jgi:uncharacterized protein YigA (DUF484 family)
MTKSHPIRPHLLAWRRQMDKTQQEVAFALNVSHSTIQRQESGRAGVDDASFAEIARFYQITPAELSAPPSEAKRAQELHRLLTAARDMDAQSLAGFLADLTGDVADTLRVDAIRLALETDTPADHPDMDPAIVVVEAGFVESYIKLGRNMPARQVTLRKFHNVGASLYGDRAPFVQSEACLKLDLGEGRRPAMLVMGSENPAQFGPSQGTDLLAFFTGVLERVLRRWLA